MNKQYVKEQISSAISELRNEYDKVVGNIYQCPDCGALALKNSEHICLPAASLSSTPKSTKSDDIITKIHQCPDCGVLTLKGSHHICPRLGTNLAPKTKTLEDYVMDMVPTTAPVEEILDASSPHTPKSIATKVKASGYSGNENSTRAALSWLWRAGKVNRRAATIKRVSISRTNKEFERYTSNFVYWKPVAELVPERV